MRLALESVDLVKQIALPSVCVGGGGGAIQSTEVPNKTKGRERRNLLLVFFCLPLELGHLISSAAFRLGFTHSFPWFSGLWTKIYHWLSWVSSWQMAGCGTSQLP